jgi:DNA (cytosine-5)-methyltransferase 1
MSPTHGSLFSGIGGIDLAFDKAGFQTLFQVEINSFCNQVLSKHWPGISRFEDVKKVGAHNLPKVTVLSGGFPCTDVSIAGNKKGIGTKDAPTDRSGLWYEFARIISELKPPWILIENVSHLRNNGADQVLADLEELNYSSWACVVGAEALGAPHQRNRVWIVGHDNSLGHRNLSEGVAERWARGLPYDCQWSLEEASQKWHYWKHVLGAGNDGSVNDATESTADAYARGVRGVHGIPDWVDRLKALGNAVVPQIPMLIGCFIKAYEELDDLQVKPE